MATKDKTAYLSQRCVSRKWIENFEPMPAYTVGSKNYVLQRTRDGVANPNWRRQVAGGENATTNMTAVLMAMEARRGRCVLHYKRPGYPNLTYTVEAEGDMATSAIDFSDPGGPYKSTEFVYNLAAAEFNRKLRSHYEQMQGLTALGELPETLRMLRGPADLLRQTSEEWLTSVRKIARKMKSPRKHWREFNKRLSQAWLETMFGWKPLIHDINDSIDAYKDLQKRLTYPKVRKVSAGAKKTWNVSDTLATKVGSLSLVGTGPVYRCIRADRYEQHTVRFKGAVASQADTPAWNDVQRAFGLDVSAFIPTAWELLPWSFLADYFTNIGDCLNSLTTVTTNVRYVNISVVTQSDTYRDWVLDQNATSPGAPWYLDSGFGDPTGSRLSKRVVNRSAGVGVPIPRLQLNFDLANGQLLNVAALLAQVIDGFPQNTTRRWHR